MYLLGKQGHGAGMPNNKKLQKEIGFRIRRAREDARLTLEEVGSACSKTPQAVHYWESGKSPIPTYAVIKISEMTGVDLKWLLAGRSPTSAGKAYAVEVTREGIDVPHIAWKDAQDIDRARQTAVRFLSARATNGPRSFALTVKDTSNAPELIPGDNCVFDPDLKPEPGRFVLAAIGKQREPKIRRYTESDEGVVLRPANDQWKADRITAKGNGEIIATMTEFSRVV